MALLLPKVTDSKVLKNNSYAESIIINLINDLDPILTKDWIIYYSYYFKGRSNKYSKNKTYIKNHNEIDFLILAPNLGIFVFEIKGGLISYSPTLGFMQMNRYTKETFRIDPYNQAKENYYGINDIIGKIYFKNRNKFLSIDKFVGGTLVGFPDITKIPNVGLQSDMIDTFVSGMDLYDFIMKNAILHKNRHDKIPPTIEDINIIKDALLGSNFVYSMGIKEYLKSVNLRLLNLTEEQETIFSSLLDNKRCLVKGGAGTGKTVLCEFLYKHKSYEENKKVLYLTKTKLIKEKIKYDLEDIKFSSCYSLNEFINSNDETIYDTLILDEAQDLENSDELINLFNKSIKGGVKDGEVYLFFDDNQRIIKRTQDKLYENEIFYDDYYRYTIFKLNKNCRNGKGIKESLNSLLNLKDNEIDSSNLKDIIENETVKYYESTNYVDITKSIIKLINNLNNSGINNGSITLLFNNNPKVKPSNIFIELNKFYKDNLIPYDFDNLNKLTYQTVSKFKGLENDIIIYVNDNINSKIEDHYVALSRAKVFAYIFKLK